MMTATVIGYVLLGMATFPFIYYLIVLYGSWRFFRPPATSVGPGSGSFTPPVSNLKPIRGLDPEAYENFASFCRQDYPDYELVFCVGEKDAPVVPVLEKLARDFPQSRIRILFGTERHAPNDKVGKLARLVSEARHEILVISDSDVRVRPDYLRTLVAPLADPKVGAVTCFYVPIEVKTLAQSLQTIGMVSDFYAGILAAWQLDGVKFALGPTIATTRTQLAGFGGYRAIEDRPADDLLVGRLIAERGYEVRLLPYTIPDRAGLPIDAGPAPQAHAVARRDAPHAPVGTFGSSVHAGFALVPGRHRDSSDRCCSSRLSRGLSWTEVDDDVAHRRQRTAGSGAVAEDVADPSVGCLAFFIWLVSFGRNSFHWRGGEYYIRDGQLVPVTGHTAEK